MVHGTAQSVVVTNNRLPASVTFVSCSSTAAGTCSGANNNRTMASLSLPSGSSGTITLASYRQPGPAGTTIFSTASAASATADLFRETTLQRRLLWCRRRPQYSASTTSRRRRQRRTTPTFTVSSSTPAAAGGITFDIATADGTARTITLSVGTNDLRRGVFAWTQTIPAGQQTSMFAVTSPRCWIQKHRHPARSILPRRQVHEDKRRCVNNSRVFQQLLARGVGRHCFWSAEELDRRRGSVRTPCNSSRSAWRW